MSIKIYNNYDLNENAWSDWDLVNIQVEKNFWKKLYHQRISVLQMQLKNSMFMIFNIQIYRTTSNR